VDQEENKVVEDHVENKEKRVRKETKEIQDYLVYKENEV
jgi:hypothetical protein